jgi:hypothetical protein
MLGTNQAVADDIPFGRAITFTYGPASSILSHAYHPATYALTCLVTVVLALILWRAVHLVAGPSQQGKAAFGVVLLAGLFDREGLLLALPWVLVVVLLRLLPPAEEEARTTHAALAVGALGMVTGVLCVAKGSMILVGATASLGCIAVAVAHRRWALAAWAVVAPLLFFGATWCLYGQSLREAPSFFRGIVALSLGYTDAMSGGSFRAGLVMYAAAVLAGGVALVCLVKSTGCRSHAVILGLTTGVTVFTAIKLGLVRADTHVLSAVSAVSVVVLIAFLLTRARPRVAVLVGLAGVYASVAVTFGPLAALLTTPLYQGQAVVTAFDWGRRLAGTDPPLAAQFESRMDEIATQSGLPRLKGRVDTYSYDQADVLANGLDWAPRPVFQSYSAFTPALADANRDHLTGDAAPEWVVFGPQAIDDRFPSIEDGPSWPELLESYKPSAEVGDKVLLERVADPSGAQPVVWDGTLDLALGERITVPRGGPIRFVAIDASPSLLGQAALTLYKSAPLQLTVWTADGLQRTYRLPAGMARAGFVLSPVVTSASEFAMLYQASSGYEPSTRTVVALRVESAAPSMWSGTAQLRLGTVRSSGS